MTTFGDMLDRARQLLCAGQLPQAEAAYRQLLESVPQAADPWHEMGLLQLQANRPEVAVDCLQRAIDVDANVAAYHGNLGAAYRILKRPAEALASFERALQLGPPTAELYNNCALARKDAGQTEAALAAFDQALRIRLDYANGHFNRGNLLIEMGRLAEAVESYRLAVQLRPDDAAAHCMLGVAYYYLGHLDETLACCEQALRLQPDYPEARYNQSLVWLARGEFQKGLSAFDWRLACHEQLRHPAGRPSWDGSALDGRTLLVYCEQGLGDTLQFIRYLHPLARAGGRVLLDVQPSLVPLLQASGFGPWLAPPGSQAEFDVSCPLLSLPRLLAERVGTPYWDRPYLIADPGRVEAWRARMLELSGFKVGIVWSGKRDQPCDCFRAMSPAQFAPLAAVPGVRWISLQKGTARDQLDEFAGGMHVADLAESMDDAGGAFMDTAAVMMHLDLVISVDTAAAHLAGGLGAAVWVPLMVSPDWRWQLVGSHTPWYPSMTLFRQREFGAWAPVFEEMAARLRSLVATNS